MTMRKFFPRFLFTDWFKNRKSFRTIYIYISTNICILCEKDEMRKNSLFYAFLIGKRQLDGFKKIHSSIEKSESSRIQVNIIAYLKLELYFCKDKNKKLQEFRGSTVLIVIGILSLKIMTHYRFNETCFNNYYFQKINLMILSPLFRQDFWF